MKYKKSLQCNTGKLACVHAKNLSQKRKSLACTHRGVYTRTAFTENGAVLKNRPIDVFPKYGNYPFPKTA